MNSYRYKTIIEIIAFFCTIVGVFVATGWLVNSFRMITLFRGYAPMKFDSALCLILSGTSLLFFFNKGKGNSLMYKLSSVAIIFIASLSSLDHFFGIHFIDKIISDIGIYKSIAVKRSQHLIRTTSLCFIIIGIAIYNLRSKNKGIQLFMQWCLHLVMLISLVAMMGHLYKVPGFYKISFFSPLAIHLAVALFILSIAVSLVNPSLGIMALFTGDQIGHIMARTLFPLITGFLLLVTYLRMEIYRHGILDVDLSIVLFTLSLILIVLFLIWRVALQLNKIDMKRKAAEDSFVVLNTDIDRKIEHRTLTLKEALQELEKSQSELKEALSKEKELNEIKTKFVSLASHEFKTPLSTILSSASLISCYEDEGGRYQREKHVERITNSVIHLNSLLEDFLSLGKLDAGYITIELSEFSMTEFLDDIMEEMRLFLKTGQTIQLNQEGNDACFTDKKLLKNILLNILSNAIKFSPENSRIELLVQNKENELLMSITDNGMGIPVDEQPYLFSSFYRAKNAANIEGTGLGLHIVKRYVDILKGNIHLQSQPGKGTAIHIGLPLLQKELV